jgi:hypothetical protein
MPRKPKYDLAVLASVLLPDSADSPTELNELLDAAIAEGTLGCIDWRQEPSGLIDATNAMLERLEAVIDWSFIDHLYDMDQGEVLRNHNLLRHLRDQLQQIELSLVHIDVGDDAYRFAVLKPADCERISGMARKNAVVITDDFGPDEFYEPARVHLSVAGFAQPARKDDPSKLARQQRARRIKTLRKLLDDESSLDPAEAAESLVPPYARWTVPAQLTAETTAWHVSYDTGLYTSWVQRRASRRLLMGEAEMAGTLRDCWRLRWLERAFLERSYLSTIRQYPDLATCTKEVSFYDASQYLELTVATAALSYCGFIEEFRQCAAFFPLFEARLDTMGSHREPLERQLLAVVRFLAAEHPTAADLDRLAATAPFNSLRGAWDKEPHFTHAIAELADWHLARCHAALSGYDDIHAPGYDFFPTWLLAITRHRQRAVGTPGLPAHELFELARPYLEADFDQPEGEQVRQLRELYENSWSGAPDWLAEWEKFLAGSG